MKDSELDPKYVAQREGLRKLVQVGARAQDVWSRPQPCVGALGLNSNPAMLPS